MNNKIHIFSPTDNDILLGRGGNNNKHIGNEKLRNAARTKVDIYKRASKKEKSEISRMLVTQIRNLDPPGRFLKRDSTRKCWNDVGDEAAREKASQALRDAVAEMARRQEDPLSHPMQDPRPLRDHSLPNSYRQRYEFDDGYNCRRMSFEDDVTVEHHRPLNSPPRIPQERAYIAHITTTGSTNIGWLSPPPFPRPTQVITPSDPQHWRDYYSGTRAKTTTTTTTTPMENSMEKNHTTFVNIFDVETRSAYNEVNGVSFDDTHHDNTTQHDYDLHCPVPRVRKGGDSSTNYTQSTMSSISADNMSTLNSVSFKDIKDVSFEEIEDFFNW